MGQDRDNTKSLMPLVSRPGRERDKTLTNFPDLQLSMTRQRQKLIEELKNRRVRDRDLLMIKIGATLRRDQESLGASNQNLLKPQVVETVHQNPINLIFMSKSMC